MAAAGSGGVYGPPPPPSVFSPGRRDLLALSGLDGRITVWDSRSGALSREYVPSAHLSATCSCLAWVSSRGRQENHAKKKRKSESPADQQYDLLTIGTATGTLFLYSVVKGELQSKLVGGHDRRVNCIRWHQENDCLYSCSDDTNIVEWNLQTYKVKCKWKGDNGSVSSLCISPDGKMLLSAGRTIKLWDLETKTQTKQFTGHSSAVTSLMFIQPPAESSNDTMGLYFLSGAVHDRLISVWQVRADQKERRAVLSFTLTDYPVAVDLAHSNSKEEPLKLAVVCQDGQLHLFEHVLNGSHKKPLAPTCTVQIATSDGGRNSATKPIPILSAAFCPSKESIYLYYGRTFQPVIEKLTLETDEPHICLLRDTKKAMAVIKETADTKVKTPIVKKDTNVLVPGIPGHSAAVSVTSVSRKQDEKRKPGVNEVSIEERLGEMDADPKESSKSALPKTDQFSTLLIQGLESKNASMLTKVLNIKHGPQIKRTVARIPVYVVLPLVHELTERLQRHPSSALIMVHWLKAVLIHHASYLSTLPDLVPQLGSLYQMLETRVKNLQKMARLNGKLDFLVSQMSLFEDTRKTQNKTQEAKLVYKEESSDEEFEDDQCTDDDVNWEELEEEEDAAYEAAVAEDAASESAEEEDAASDENEDMNEGENEDMDENEYMNEDKVNGDSGDDDEEN